MRWFLAAEALAILGVQVWDGLDRTDLAGFLAVLAWSTARLGSARPACAGSRLPRPYLHGYALEAGHPAEDVSEALSASALWAARRHRLHPGRYEPVHPRLPRAPVLLAAHPGGPFPVHGGQLRPGGAGRQRQLPSAIFRYRTRCGTVYGHTENFLGYTQLAAASRGGAHPVSVTATEQLNLRVHPRVLAALRHAELLAVCAALGRRSAGGPATSAAHR